MIQMASKNELPVISLAKIYWQEFLEDLRQMYLIMNLKRSYVIYSYSTVLSYVFFF